MEEIVKRLLEKRGIKSELEIEEFFSSKPRLTFDPCLLPDMKLGVDLILDEINKGSKIMIYGDYDCDGITATALMYQVLTRLTKTRVSYYIPKRDTEGYGLNMDAIKNIHDMGYDFIITVDCGSTSYAEVEFIKSLNMRVLVTDHHNITDKQVDTLLINPKRPDSTYPFTELSGCGVAFKLAQELINRMNKGRELLTEVLDLVAIGTIADIMSLTSENRTLVKYGLRVINSGKRKGLKKLIEAVSLNLGSVTSSNIGYVIGPHLNASGRMDDAKIAVELMIEDDDEKLDSIVSSLILKNIKRKKFQEEAFNLGLEKLKDNKDRFIFLRLDDSHEGILGIVAGKIKEEFYRPTVILSKIKDTNLLKGTGRSIAGVDIYELLNKYSDLFIKFGGHSLACGFTIEEDKFDILKEKVLSDINTFDDNLFIKKDNYDLEISSFDINNDLVNELNLFEPYGKNNEKPKFMISTEIKDVSFMGEDNKHLKFDSNNINFVLFNHAKEYKVEDLIGYKKVIGDINFKTFRNNTYLQVIVDKIL